MVDFEQDNLVFSLPEVICVTINFPHLLLIHAPHLPFPLETVTTQFVGQKKILLGNTGKISSAYLHTHHRGYAVLPKVLK